MRAIIIDIGGVLIRGRSPTVIDTWAARLGIGPHDLRAAIYGGSDDQVLVGRMDEDSWWAVVRSRLGGDADQLRADIEADGEWDEPLVAAIGAARSTCRTAILSNAWPSQRARIVASGQLGVVDEILLSCEIGRAKPDREAFLIALDRLGATPTRTLFVDDTAENVRVAASLGLHGHLHTDSRRTARTIRTFAASPAGSADR